MDKVWYLLVVVAAIVLTVPLGIWGYASAEDAATATGPVVTALATIGAAIFGIAVGRESGKAEGKEAGRAAGHEQGTAAGRKSAVAELIQLEEGTAESALEDAGRTGSRGSTPTPLRKRMLEILGE